MFEALRWVRPQISIPCSAFTSQVFYSKIYVCLSARQTPIYKTKIKYLLYLTEPFLQLTLLNIIGDQVLCYWRHKILKGPKKCLYELHNWKWFWSHMIQDWKHYFDNLITIIYKERSCKCLKSLANINYTYLLFHEVLKNICIFGLILHKG